MVCGIKEFIELKLRTKKVNSKQKIIFKGAKIIAWEIDT